MKVELRKHTLIFKFDAGTSRGVLKTRDVWYIFLQDENMPSLTGIGEIAPLKGLSHDDRPDFETTLARVCERLRSLDGSSLWKMNIAEALDIVDFPSIVFGIETALSDLIHGGRRKMMPESDFFDGRRAIPINGLIWMGDREFMREQIERKLAEGYTCLKMKIGALDFDTELSLIEMIRKEYSAEQIVLRLDANGAFDKNNVMEVLGRLSGYAIHSIEQPIRQGRTELMAYLCRHSPIPVALDEELIGVYDFGEKKGLLEACRPPYIILKPSLLGGFRACDEWIDLAISLGIGWWITSALESNIGLNAIAQYTASKTDGPVPQGLGTGQLYTNNISSPLEIDKGSLRYNKSSLWGDVTEKKQ